MKVGFTGTQRGMTETQASTVKSLLLLNRCREFHHGDCIGADAQAHDIATALSLLTVSHPPIVNLKRANKKADVILPAKDYLDRNRDIVRETDMLVATPGETEEQLRSGTWSTVRYARKLVRRIWIVWPDGTLKREPA